MDGYAKATQRKSSGDAPSIVASLTTNSPDRSNRPSLFDDAPLSTQHVPGSIHHANDEHIERLIARNGAVALVRQIAEDLAQRDAQIASLKRKAEGRERALRKIILECGLSNLDMETRLRAIEAEKNSTSDQSSELDVPTGEMGLEDLMNDAMSETVVMGELELTDNDATIRAAAKLNALQDDKPVSAAKGWKDYIWGGTSRTGSRTNSINGDMINGTDTTRRPSAITRKSVLQNDLFQPPNGTKGSSRASSQHSAMTPTRERKPSSSLATLALKLVAGTANRDSETTGRGRANSAETAPAGRTHSTASTRTTMSARPAPKPATKAIPTGRRPTGPIGGTIRAPPDRWDTMGASPQNITPGPGSDNFGPVEMDTILPPDAQPPTLTHIYNNTFNSEFLIDRFGFIYDQRRKKRQREAAEKVRKSKRGSRVEMLSSARSGLSPDAVAADMDDIDYERPDTPISIEDDGKPIKRWQDYLKIATFPTELLSHTPAGSVPAFEVMEGGEVPRSPVFLSDRNLSPTREMPKSPAIKKGEGGLVLPASTAAAVPTIPVVSENATISIPDTTAPAPSELAMEDTEPVKILLKQLGEVHDSLQREKTPRWNDFLRKVRAERKRDGEAAAAAQLANTLARSHKPITLMPEASLTDGEMIGVAGLGNKGKVGRAKWAEFKALVLGGIPVAYRAKIWAECSGASALKIPGYYEDLVARKEEDDDPAIVAQIQMDINRTLTDNIFFRKGPGVVKLNEVLLAYSRRNAEVGYCQGMNLITACLLLIMPTAEDAFWVLVSIIEKILPRGYYDHHLLASRADQQVLRQYVTEILPKLSSHLDDLSIELEALTFQWFLSVFTDCLSAEALFRVWDVVFCINDGSTFLFQVALALLKLNEKQLLECQSPAGVYTYINHQMTNHAISIDGLIHASEGLRKVVKRDEVESRRAKAIEAEKELMKMREERNAKRKMERIAALNEAVPEMEAEAETSGVSSPEEGSLKITEPVPIYDEA